MKQLETSLGDIFTEYDDSIFQEGSIDPMGLRILWTAMGNQIYSNKLNTISTDIRYYTLNLFHHSLIRKLIKENEIVFHRRQQKAPYHNATNLIEGLIIFLENLLIHNAQGLQKIGVELQVPGLNKLGFMQRNLNTDSPATRLKIDRHDEILARQYLLGIHGRHKNPFIQMGILNASLETPYTNQEIWEEAAQLFQHKGWKELSDRLYTILKDRVLNQEPPKDSAYKIELSDLLSDQLMEHYSFLASKQSFTQPEFRRFWLKRLGLNEKTAQVVLNEIELAFNQSEEAIQNLKMSAIASKHADDAILKNIVTIEPLITCVDKCATHILKRGNTEVDDSLCETAQKWLTNGAVKIEAVEHSIEQNLEGMFNESALQRFHEIIAMYKSALQKNSPKEWIKSLVNYHNKIMQNRGQMAWVQLEKENRLKLNRSYSQVNIEELRSPEWVNSYYLPTVLSLYRGLI